MKTAIVIGGGPAGLNFAAKTARTLDTTVFEEHSQIGMPIQCTGIITSSIERAIHSQALMARIKKEAVINSIRDIEVFSPNNKSLHIELKKDDLILQRNIFDTILKENAEDNGAKILENYRLAGIKNHEAIVFDRKEKKIKKIKYDFLIGADGPKSTTAALSAMLDKREYFTGVQARIKLKKKTENTIRFYPFLRDIAWFVPETENIARVGVMKRRNVLAAFKEFTKRFEGKTIEIQGGLIPVYSNSQKIQDIGSSTFLIGDAAGHAKATTGGGIIPGLRAGNLLAETIENGSYERTFRKTLARELWAHLMIRKALDRFSGKDWNSLVRECQDEKIKKILASTSRDNAGRLARKIITARPGLVKYGMKLLK
ncbi:MAG: NAD(P)/FAD-dependent oxidoreductase [Candidatus Woesearchaeota archaeon]